MNIYQNCFINTQRELLVDPLFQMKYKVEARSYLLLRKSERGDSGLITESSNLSKIATLLDDQARKAWQLIQKDVHLIKNNVDYEKIRIEYKEHKDSVNNTIAQVKEYL